MRLSSLLCVLLVWEWKSTNGNLGTLSKLLLSHFRMVVVEKRGRRRFSSILIRLSFYIFSYFPHYSNWILHAIKRSSVAVVLPRSGTSKDFKWKKRKTFYAFICQKSCVQKSCVTLELASKVLLQQGQGQQLVLLSSEVFAEKIVSKQVIQIIKGKLILSATFGRCDGDADGHQHGHILRLGAPFSKGFIYS